MALRQPRTDIHSVAHDADDASDASPSPIRMRTLVEGQAFFDDMTRQRLAISGDEFVRRYYAGRYDDILDDPDHSDLIYLAMLGGLGW